MNAQLATIGGQQIGLSDAITRVLSPNGSLLGFRRYLAAKHGIATEQKDGKLTFSEIEGKTTKEVKAMIVAAGGTDAQIKVSNGEYDAGRTAFYDFSTKATALIGADSTLRKDVRMVNGKKGLIGFNVKARYVKASTGSSSKVAELEAKVARLTALLGEQALLKA